MMVNADGVDDFPFTDPCPHHHLFYIHAYPSFHITPYPWFFFVCQTAIPKGAPAPALAYSARSDVLRAYRIQLP